MKPSKSQTPSQGGESLPQRFKPVSEADLRRWTDEGSISRGVGYFRSGHLFDPVLRGNTLRARCAGSSGGPYTLEATLVPETDSGTEPLAHWECNCPRGGFCKHLVALLLAWIRTPEAFDERPEIMDLLKDRSRDELIALVQKMLQRAPELETLLDVFALKQGDSGPGGRVTVNPTAIRKQARSVMASFDYEWDSAPGIARDLEEIRKLADGYALAERWADAAVIYAVIAEEALEGYEETGDEGDIAEVISESIDGLAMCLEVQESLDPSNRMDPSTRQPLIQSLYGLWRDEDYGIDPASDIPEILAGQTTEEERREIERWARSDIASRRSEWRNLRLVRLLIRLKAAAGLSDEELFEEYRTAGLYKDLTGLLLE
ncbi:MAG: SWIM zinc finger family protein, partial [Armatimonadetes bacterium]|nr:SWIM zinc finger family protein [Armatimonadota bacterium]